MTTTKPKRTPMFGEDKENGKLRVLAAAQEVADFGMPIQLSLVIKRMEKKYPELDLGQRPLNTVKQAVYQILRAHGVKLSKTKK